MSVRKPVKPWNKIPRCSFPGCVKARVDGRVSSLCISHNMQQRSGRELTPLKARCRICREPVFNQGLCRQHYEQHESARVLRRKIGIARRFLEGQGFTVTESANLDLIGA